MSQDRPPSDISQGQPPPDLPPAPPIDRGYRSVAKPVSYPALGKVLIWTVVIGFFTALGVALLVPQTTRIRDTGPRTLTINNLSQIAKAAHSAHDAYKRLPPGQGRYAGMDGTVLYHLLPFVESNDVWSRGPEGAKPVVVSVYLSPLDTTSTDGRFGAGGPGGASFAGNIAVFGKGKGLRFGKEFEPMGVSNVLMFATVAINCTDGGHTHSDPANPPLFGSDYPFAVQPPSPRQGIPFPLSRAGLYVAMADASVRSVGSNVSAETWAIVIDPKSAGPVPADWND